MPSPRCLRSKKLRALLWYAAGGKCQSCGRELPDDWHADHVVPYVVTGRTNVHEMQALCPACNRRKGSLVAWELQPSFRLRQHQVDFQLACREIVRGEPVDKILCSVTPGGGKSSLPVIAASELLRPQIADRICWVAPRVSLQKQAEKAFLESRLRSYLGHNHQIRVSTNDFSPARGNSGYVTTYHAIAADSLFVNRQEFETCRYILVLDEVHHVEEGGLWHKALQPLIDRARIVIPMTGSLNRGDGKRIATLPYRSVPGGEMIDLESSVTTAVVRYTRQDALRERAIIPILFSHADARAEWVDGDGELRTIDSFDDAARDGSDALCAALGTGFAYSLLDRALASWNAHKAVNRRSKLIVVAASQAVARLYLDHVKQQGFMARIAISDDGKEALNNIEAFKEVRRGGGVDILITVGMCYEGLDVPPITHLACLTHIRSGPWIEQMLARANRHDPDAGEWDSQTAHAFVPDDYEMRTIIKQILEEQEAVVGEARAKVEGVDGEGPSPRESSGKILPMASDITRERCSDLSNGEAIGFDETRQIQEEMDRQAIAGVNPLQIKRLILSLGFTRPFNGTVVPAIDEPLMTPSEREANLRKSIQKFCSANDITRGWEHGDTNRLVIKEFEKIRDRMTVQELMDVWSWLQREYPMEDSHAGQGQRA